MHSEHLINPIAPIAVVAIVATFATVQIISEISEYELEAQTQTLVLGAQRPSDDRSLKEIAMQPLDLPMSQVVTLSKPNTPEFVQTYSSSNENTLTAQERQQFIEQHNAARAEAGVAPLSWSASLAESAQSWANTLAATDGCTIRHSSLDSVPYGENLYSFVDGNVSSVGSDPETAVALWVAEERDYDYSANLCAPGKMCGHYTQVVWETSREVGCAKAVCIDEMYKEAWVCHYNPPGNFVGQRPY